MRYIDEVIKTESDCDPLVLQWFWDVVKNPFHTINVRNFDADKIKALEKTLTKVFNKPASRYSMEQFKKIIQIYDQYMTEIVIQSYQIDGIDKIFQIHHPSMKKEILIDAKGTPGYRDPKTGVLIPSYGKVYMETYHNLTSLGDDETVHRLSYPWLKPVSRSGWEDDEKYILFISELLAILVPKVRLNEAMRDPRYAYMFASRDIPWKKNPRDKKDDRLVKNTRFDLERKRDLQFLVDVIEAEFSLRNNNGIYVPFTPTIRSVEQIKQNYLKNLNSTSRTLYRNDI